MYTILPEDAVASTIISVYATPLDLNSRISPVFKAYVWDKMFVTIISAAPSLVILIPVEPFGMVNESAFNVMNFGVVKFESG